MTNLHILRIVKSCCIVVLFISCKKADTAVPHSSTEADTRQLVLDAYARVNPMNIQATYNTERAEMMKTMLDGITDPGKRINLELEYAFELLKVGKSLESLKQYETTYKTIVDNKISLDPMTRRNLYFILGMAYMRHGEIENCVKNHNHESCFIPIKGEGVHELPFGSRKAIAQFEAVLKEIPNDLEAKYLLNLAYMTLGEYPDKVPAAWRIDPSWYTNKVKIQRFKDIAPQLGVNRNGLAGGVVMDDFTNDGWLDIVVTSWNHKDPTLFYENNGDGTFTDKSVETGLIDHLGSLHLNQTDFNNDGWLDLYIMRGAWYMKQGDIPNTLLMNTGKGTFVDVTLKAGLTHHAGTQASAWADFNLDGWLDLVVANESIGDYIRGIDLYINQQDGTFTHESAVYGLTQNEFIKGVVAVDANNDRYPDIYLSSLTNGNMLLINQGLNGQKSFVPSGPTANVKAPLSSFPCWNFDYDNDGNEDLFVSAFSNDKSPAVMWMQDHVGKTDKAFLPKLYRNKGNLVFEDVSDQMGLNEVAYTMGCSFGDINTDGFLDFYLATGNPLYQSLVPNKMYLNMDGKKFEDVSYSGGFANIQKGHGVSFGDWDHDGDEDLYAVIGGAYDGDFFYNCFFENPNENNNNWIVLKLEGKEANKAAIGARVAVIAIENGKERKIHRTVTSGASFGANSLALEVGLRKSTSISSVIVQWPCKDCPEQVYTGMEINKAYALAQWTPAPKSLVYNSVKPGASKGHDHH
jgi:tetratricopeptide (TPR) repeat protein